MWKVGAFTFWARGISPHARFIHGYGLVKCHDAGLTRSSR